MKLLGAVCGTLLAACTTAPKGVPSTEPPDTLRVAVCQLRCIDGDREGNLARIAAAVR